MISLNEVLEAFKDRKQLCKTFFGNCFLNYTFPRILFAGDEEQNMIKVCYSVYYNDNFE